MSDSLAHGTDSDAAERAPPLLHFPVVGIGASAGGLSAASRLLEHLPSNPGMALVVVLHLSPRHESNAAAVLQRSTRMQVSQVTGAVPIEPDHVYVIAPGLQIEMSDGQLVVHPLERQSGRPVTIDTFFRTLARVHRERAIAVVLSGAGSDGSLGLAEIKGQGGVAIAQAPSDAEYDAMPVAAVATDRVDFVLPVAEIGQKLLDLWANAQRIELPNADAINVEAELPQSTDAAARSELALREVMATLLERTGHDFRTYKRSTVLRRLERRLQVTQQSDVPAYLEYLKGNLHETEALLQDMLITVTSFFRDRDAFEALEREVVTSILDRRSGGGRFVHGA